MDPNRPVFWPLSTLTVMYDEHAVWQCVRANAPLSQVSLASRLLRLSQAHPDTRRKWLHTWFSSCSLAIITKPTSFPGNPCGPAGPVLPFSPWKCHYHYCQLSSSEISEAHSKGRLLFQRRQPAALPVDQLFLVIPLFLQVRLSPSARGKIRTILLFLQNRRRQYFRCTWTGSSLGGWNG